MDFEGNEVENVPLEERNEWGEDEEEETAETSFTEPLFDDPTEEPQSLVFYPWSEVPAEHFGEYSFTTNTCFGTSF